MIFPFPKIGILSRRTFLLLCCMSASAMVFSQNAGAQLKTYQSKYYAVESDLEPLDTRDLMLRADMMAAQYSLHFPALRGAITHKFKLGFYKDGVSAHAGGGPAAAFSAGYNVRLHKVLVVNLFGVNKMQWGMQSHCFEQFCLESLTNDQQSLPRWLETGMCKYFEFALFTGDGYECGLFPDGWMEGTQNLIRNGTARPIPELISLNRQQFKDNDALAVAQAWSVVYYLAWGDNQKHWDAFSAYQHDIGRGIKHDEAWRKAFGDLDIDASWKRWWLAQKPDVLQEAYARTTAATLAAYLGRASIQGQHFTKVPDLLQAIRQQKIKIADSDWLPANLIQTLDRSLPHVGADTKLEIGPNLKTPQIIATLANHTRVVATFDPVKKEARTLVEVDGPGRPKRTTATAGAIATTIVLQSARFGAGDTWVDVTEKCRPMVVDDMMLAPQNLAQAFGISPAAIGLNSLELNLVVNGAKVRIILTDNRKIAPFRITTQIPSDLEE